MEFLREETGLDRILLIPAKMPVHKNIKDKILPEERFEMTSIAVTGNQYIEVSDIEIRRETPSYTIFTFNELRNSYPEDELYLIIGSDSFNELDTWKSYNELLAETPVIVMKRPGSIDLRNDIKEITREVITCENPLIDISSTMIRERLKKGLSVRYLMPDHVIDYINRKELYKN